VTAETESGLNKHVHGWKGEIPVYSNQIPRSGAEWEDEEKMMIGFFWANDTEDTAVIIEGHVFPPQNISCTEPIFE